MCDSLNFREWHQAKFGMVWKIVVPRNFFIATCLLAACLWLISVAQDICFYGFQCADLQKIIGLLDVEAEVSIYTWYSVCLLFLTGFMAFRHADLVGKGDRHFRQWVGIGLLFVYLSADESLSIHEKFARIGAMVVEPSGFFRFAWVIPATVLVVIVTIALISLIADLPKRERFWAIASGAVFFGGAVGMEMVDAKISSMSSPHTIAYQAVNSLEEAMEVIGVLIFLWVLTSLERKAKAA